MSRSDVDDFLARTDVLLDTCGTCGNQLRPDGPSLYYCNERCAPGELGLSYHEFVDALAGLANFAFTVDPTPMLNALELAREQVGLTWLRLHTSGSPPLRASAEPVRYARVTGRSGHSAGFPFGLDDFGPEGRG